ncbi:hypothetical protein F4802DRAFT_381676 [Xylaria palmicola]|nr:hypothetical protein F4802DRAFT_381676 [Xylaria palmicola]
MATSDDPRLKFGLTCPVNGTFYICQDASTRFVGCCSVDPCTPEQDGRCPAANLYNASFSASSGVAFLPQNCAAPYDSGSWYTCTFSVPPFLGCCTRNPCNDGCPADHLVPAALSEDPDNAAQFLLPNETASTSTSPGPSSSTGATPSPSSTTPADPGAGASSGMRIGIIVGTSLAGVLILLAVIAGYLWLKRREEARQAYAGDSDDFDMSRGGTFTFTPSPIPVIETPPAEKNGPYRITNPDPPSPSNPRISALSPSLSEQLHSRHSSYISELEGSSRWNR